MKSHKICRTRGKSPRTYTQKYNKGMWQLIKKRAVQHQEPDITKVASARKQREFPKSSCNESTAPVRLPLTLPQQFMRLPSAHACLELLRRQQNENIACHQYTHLVAQKLWQIHQRRCQSMWHARISSGCWLTVSYCNKYKLLVGLPSSWHVAATTNCMPQCTIEWCTQFNCDFWLIAFRHLIGRMLLSCS